MWKRIGEKDVAPFILSLSKEMSGSPHPFTTGSDLP